MAVTELQRAKRALLAVMLALGRLYGCILGVNRDSPDQEVTSALRRLVKMVHPDKGGKAADAAKLNGARDVWEEAKKKTHGSGGHNKAPPNEDPEDAQSQQLTAVKQSSDYRIRGAGVLLTFQKFDDIMVWLRFIAFVEAKGCLSVLVWTLRQLSVPLPQGTSS